MKVRDLGSTARGATSSATTMGGPMGGASGRLNQQSSGSMSLKAAGKAAMHKTR